MVKQHLRMVAPILGSVFTLPWGPLALEQLNHTASLDFWGMYAYGVRR